MADLQQRIPPRSDVVADKLGGFHGLLEVLARLILRQAPDRAGQPDEVPDPLVCAVVASRDLACDDVGDLKCQVVQLRGGRGVLDGGTR
jgi:hypothetical protein